jgi:hypothetical protein
VATLVLYTPLAWEDIFPADLNAGPLQEVWVDGRLCLARTGPDGVRRLERLLSTDPQDFLDPRFQPTGGI